MPLIKIPDYAKPEVAKKNYSSLVRGLISLTPTYHGFLATFLDESTVWVCEGYLVGNTEGMEDEEVYSTSVTIDGELYWDEMRVIAIHSTV